MSKLSALFVLSCLLALALALPETRLQQQQQRQLRQQQQKLQHPYLFFSVPRGRANGGAVVQGFEIVEDHEDMSNDDDDDDDESDMPLQRRQLNDAEDDDDDELNDDDDDEDDELEMEAQQHLAQRGLGLGRNGQLVLLNGRNQNLDDDDDEEQDDDVDAQLPVVVAKPGSGLVRKSNALNGQQLLKNAKPTQMMVARDQAGAIMVPDGIIEIEGQSVVDEKTGKAALLVPRAALDAIPDGAVVALMERSTGQARAAEEERANRVIVRRRKTGGRRNVQRRRRGGRPVNRRRRGGNVRRRGAGNNRRRNVRVVRPTANRRRGGGQRRRGQVMLQG